MGAFDSLIGTVAKRVGELEEFKTLYEMLVDLQAKEGLIKEINVECARLSGMRADMLRELDSLEAELKSIKKAIVNSHQRLQVDQSAAERRSGQLHDQLEEVKDRIGKEIASAEATHVEMLAALHEEEERARNAVRAEQEELNDLIDRRNKVIDDLVSAKSG